MKRFSRTDGPFNLKKFVTPQEKEPFFLKTTRKAFFFSQHEVSIKLLLSPLPLAVAVVVGIPSDLPSTSIFFFLLPLPPLLFLPPHYTGAKRERERRSRKRGDPPFSYFFFT